MDERSGCWRFVAARSTAGYGRFYFGDRVLQAHRVSYEALVGGIPPGLVLDHKVCQTPCCVNPNHLEPVTTGENTRRGTALAMTLVRCAAISHCPHGHAYDETNTLVFTKRNGRRQRVCRACGRIRMRARRTQAKESQP